MKSLDYHYLLNSITQSRVDISIKDSLKGAIAFLCYSSFSNEELSVNIKETNHILYIPYKL
ncbi:hypothetical protein RV12_GL000094 [Enterococcus quebecensis]|nr:hypothetical protein RV12_GL000094 [Enterococcus quebecensis]